MLEAERDAGRAAASPPHHYPGGMDADLIDDIRRSTCHRARLTARTAENRELDYPETRLHASTGYTPITFQVLQVAAGG